jgi:hypothetical protein
MTMDAQTGEVAGASVQIGAPIVEKGLIDVTIQARDSGIYHAITDCGAGGLSSAVGEMSSEIGAEIHLDTVRLKSSPPTVGVGFQCTPHRVILSLAGPSNQRAGSCVGYL